MQMNLRSHPFSQLQLTKLEQGAAPPGWWTVKGLAAAIGLSPRTVYDAIAAGELRVHRFGPRGGGIRIADGDRREWEQQSRAETLHPVPTPVRPRHSPEVQSLITRHLGR